MAEIVADTHTAIWYLFQPSRLSISARNALAQAQLAGDSIYIPSISLVEARHLVERRRITGAVLERLVEELMEPNSSLTLVSLDLDIAGTVGQVPRADIPDMPDRIIAATALYLDLPLVTADRRIRMAGIVTIW